MGDSTSGDGGNDDPDRAWRPGAPDDPAEPPLSVPASGADDAERAVWGPQATARAASGTASSLGSAAWSPPPAGAVPGPSAAAAPARRWEPVGTLRNDAGWAGPGPYEVGIDERRPPPPRQPEDERFAGWWTRAGILAAVLAVVIAVIAVASGSDSDGDASSASSTPTTSGAPPTTARRTAVTTAPATTTTTTEAPASGNGSTGEIDAADLAPEDDPRVMLTDLPDGYTAVNARLLLDNIEGGMAVGDLLFVADGSTWFDGPWIRIGPAIDAAFIGPVAAIDLGGRSGRLGTSDIGAEMAVVDAAGGAVAVAAKGLPPATASAIATAIAATPDGVRSLPAGALPPGMGLATGDLADALGVREGSSASATYQTSDGAGVTVYSRLAQPGYDPQALAPFFLSDLAYVAIGGEPGVMGTYHFQSGSSFRSLQWRDGGVDIELTAYGLDTSQLLELAVHASTRAGGGWTERDWAAAENGVGRESSEVVLVEQALDFGDDGGGTAMASATGTTLSWWVDGSTGFSVGRYGQDATLPVVLQVASNPVAAIDTDGASHVVALVLGDASIEGATLRLRVGSMATGGEGDGSERTMTVHPLGVADDGPGATDDTDQAGGTTQLGYTLGAAAASPWPAGEFVAELVAADGVTVLATATTADLR